MPPGTFQKPLAFMFCLNAETASSHPQTPLSIFLLFLFIVFTIYFVWMPKLPLPTPRPLCPFFHRFLLYFFLNLFFLRVCERECVCARVYARARGTKYLKNKNHSERIHALLGHARLIYKKKIKILYWAHLWERNETKPKSNMTRLRPWRHSERKKRKNEKKCD